MTPDPIDFSEATGASLERANPDVALLERMNRYGYRVLLPDGENTHHVTIARDDGPGFVGTCKTYDCHKLAPCKGHKYGAGPCAHIVTVRRADMDDDHDLHIYQQTSDDVGAATNSQLATDGGRR